MNLQSDNLKESICLLIEAIGFIEAYPTNMNVHKRAQILGKIAEAKEKISNVDHTIKNYFIVK